MATEHLSFKVFSRTHGANAVMKAAYRAGASLYDESLGVTYSFEHKTEVAAVGILAPEDAPAWATDRQALWNHVERGEGLKNSQLAREFDVALPIELALDEQHALLVEYLQDHFVRRGMVADFSIHAKPDNPHAHVMLTMRSIGPDGFGKKVRAWNDRALVKEWRQAWEDCANRALASAGRHERIDMRSYAARGLELEPKPKRFRSGRDGRPDARDLVAERMEENEEVAARNGAKLLARPELALELLTSRQSFFTEHELLAVIHRHTRDDDTFHQVRLAVLSSPELVRIPGDDETARYTTRAVVSLEESLLRSADTLHRSAAHMVDHARVEAAIAATIARDPLRAPNSEQTEAVRHIARSGDLAILQGYAGSGKSTTLRIAREALEAQGLTVVGGALAGKAAEGLTGSAGIQARTLASWEFAWSQGRDLLTANHVLVIDEAGMVGTAQMERVLARVQRAGAKVVLVGDTRQLAAIDPGAPMAMLQDRLGAARLTEVVRQSDTWQREATKHFGDGHAHKALEAYAAASRFHRHDTREAARAALVERWSADRAAHPGATNILLAFRRADVRALNEAARAVRKTAGELGPDVILMTHDGPRTFATNDRVVFLKNDRKLGVTNGTLATVVAIQGLTLRARTDDGALIDIDTRDYKNLDHGYASTIHKSQGVTVDRAYVLASRYMDSAAAYVALSRQRKDVELHWDREEFTDQAALVERLATTRTPRMALDEALAAERSPAGSDEQDDLFALLSDTERERFLDELGREAHREPTSGSREFDQLPAVQDARAERKAADEACRAASRALEAFRDAHPVAAKLRSPEYRSVAEALAAAQERLLLATERLNTVESDTGLRSRADARASRHNVRIRVAQQRLARFRAGILRERRTATLNKFVAIANAQLGRTAYRTAIPSDAGRRMEVALIKRVVDMDVVVLRPTEGRGHLVTVDANDFPALPARGTSVVLAPSGRPQVEGSMRHGPQRHRSE